MNVPLRTVNEKPREVLAACPRCKAGYRFPVPDECPRCRVLDERRVVVQRLPRWRGVA